MGEYYLFLEHIMIEKILSKYNFPDYILDNFIIVNVTDYQIELYSNGLSVILK